jgi:hypothetical protein
MSVATGIHDRAYPSADHWQRQPKKGLTRGGWTVVGIGKMTSDLDKAYSSRAVSRGTLFLVRRSKACVMDIIDFVIRSDMWASALLNCRY